MSRNGIAGESSPTPDGAMSRALHPRRGVGQLLLLLLLGMLRVVAPFRFVRPAIQTRRRGGLTMTTGSGGGGQESVDDDSVLDEVEAGLGAGLGDELSPPPASEAALAGPFAKVKLEHTSTVALVPPEDAWPTLQAARDSLRDKGLYRWPPHFNLLYPFLPPKHFEAAVATLAPALASLEPFSITLDNLSVFGGRTRGVLWCGPSDPAELQALRRLQATLQAAIPSCHHQQRPVTDEETNTTTMVFNPHLTLAHFDSAAEAEVSSGRRRRRHGRHNHRHAYCHRHDHSNNQRHDHPCQNYRCHLNHRPGGARRSLGDLGAGDVHRRS